jgi:cysteinyl-tRNA synthetase
MVNFNRKIFTGVKLLYCIYIIVSLILVIGCKKRKLKGINFRQEMVAFVKEISAYSRAAKPGFIIIPQNGHHLLTNNGISNGRINLSYVQAIDGVGREDLLFGYEADNLPTVEKERDSMIAFMDIAKANNVTPLITDYCNTNINIDFSYNANAGRGYLSFAATERNLNTIPTYPLKPFNENGLAVNKLSDAKNFLYIINSELFTSKLDFINKVAFTNYDVIIMDLFFNEETFTATEITQLKTKPLGGKRLVIAYMSIGEAEDYRYYWKKGWKVAKPKWLYKQNPDWKGNYDVFYWNKDWQNIIYGNNNSYTNKIINAGFDGAYLDIIDGFERFEVIVE